jgi:hypothetical protein
VDPEYVWLRNEGNHERLKSGKTGNKINDIAGENGVGRGSGRLISSGTRDIATVGSLGVVLQCAGLLWLLYTAGFAIPWYSVFPVAIMIAGGVFIVRAVIHGRERTGRGAISDRRNHQGN